MITMEYVVAFRAHTKSPQQEAKFYTPQAAEIFADGILQAGGVAIVTEDVQDIPADDSIQHPARTLQW